MSDPILDNLYTSIKENEEKFPIPVASENFFMGTFDVKRGSFTGKTSTERSSFEDIAGPIRNPVRYIGDTKITTRLEGRKLITERMHAPETEAVKAILKFTANYPEKSPNATEDPPEWEEEVHFTARGKSEVATKESPTVRIDVGTVMHVNWSVSGNGKHYDDSIEFRRPPIVVLGGFTIPAVPVTILYEPPPDKSLQSFAQQITTTTMGTTFTTGFKEEGSTTKPTQPREYQSAMKMKSGLETAASILSNIPNPVLQAGAQAMKVIASGLGEASAKITEGNVTSEEHSITTTNTKERELTTGPPNNGGPGVGDVIFFLKNMRFLWYAHDGQFALCPVDPGDWSNARVGFLTEHIADESQTGLSQSVVKTLLALDPFVADGPAFDPSSSDRYRRVGTEDHRGTGAPESFLVRDEITETDRKYQEQFTTIMEDYRPGFLSAVGMGITERKTVESTTSNSSSSSVTNSKKVETKVTFVVAEDEIYVVDIYLDRIFGTFAFKSAKNVSAPIVSGKLEKASGAASAMETLELKQGTRLYRTKTDNEGNFAFHAAAIELGPATLQSRGQVLKKVTIQPDRMPSDLLLRLPD